MTMQIATLLDDSAPGTLAVRQLSVFYGDKKAMGPVTMTIPGRRVTALIGPSGCGKSTFLRSLNRMNELIPGCRVEGALTHAALWDEVKDRLHESALGLSGGQQQRLCIARALAVEPNVILMDEPASALDPIATAHIEELIHELARDYTVVIVTHNMQQAARVSHNTAFFYMGDLIEFDTTQTIFTKPTQSRTEDYITGRFG